MPRRALLCVLFFAVLQVLGSALAVAAEDLPVSTGVLRIAEELGLDPARDRARLLSELVRLLYTPPPGKNPSLEQRLRNEARGTNRPAEIGDSLRIPVPLSANSWSRAVLQRTIPAERVVAAILADRRAALMSYALAALDDETLAYLEQQPLILRQTYEESALTFGAFGASLRIAGGQVVPPGGPAAVALWEALIGAPVREPERFIAALYGQLAGRVAYLYDTVAHLDAAHGAFALGLWIDDASVRPARLIALAQAVASGYPEWRPADLPFSRPAHDLAVMLARMDVEPSGAPAGLTSVAFWGNVFESQTLPSDRDPLREAPQDSVIDAAWLLSATDPAHAFVRGDRLDQFAFGQRVFGHAPPSTWTDVLVAVRAFPRQRMLMLTLERTGITSPATYAAVARQTVRHTTNDSQRSFWTLSQLQGAVAIASKMARVRTIDVKAAEALIVAAVRLPVEGERYDGRFLRWLENELVPVLPAGAPGSGVEGRILAGLAGRPPGRGAPRIEWEGAEYRLDLAAAEHERLATVRAKQGGYTVDLAVTIDEIARAVSARNVTLDVMQHAAATLTALLDDQPSRLRRTLSPVLPAGVELPREARDVIGRAADELQRAIAGKDPRRAARIVEPFQQLIDVVLGDALLSLAYAADIGDPDGAALLGSNVALRHDYGFRYRDSDVRLRSYWAIPRQDFLPGVPWHVAGSALGLDLALAPLHLRRLTPGGGIGVPLLPSADREALAIGAVLLDPRALTDSSRDAIAAALRAGRARVTRLVQRTEPPDAIASEIGIDPWRLRALRWLQNEDPERIADLFSMTELLMLGLPAGGSSLTSAGLDAWGTMALQTRACACTALVHPREWRVWTGRQHLGFIGSVVADLNLRVAEVLSELRLPASLAPHVVTSATQDFIDAATPTDPNDWVAISRGARAVSRVQIEDYVAAAAAVGGPLVPVESAAAGQRR